MTSNAKIQPAAISNQEKTQVQISTAAAALSEGQTMMMCVYGRVINLKTMRNKKVPIFVDSGSTESYITKKLAKELGLEFGPTAELVVNRFGDKTGPMTVFAPIAEFGIESPDDQTLVIKGLAVNEIIGAIAHIPKLDDSVYQGVELHLPTRNNPPQVMLGVELFSQLKIMFNLELPSGFALYQSTLGPLICGRGQLRKAVVATATCATSIKIVKPTMEEDLHQLVKAYFESESCNI